MSDQQNTNTKPPSDPWCVKCKNFYGNPDKENMCSVCYKTAKPKTETTVKQETKPVETKPEVKQEEAPIVEEKKEDNTPKQTDTGKCWKCSKKVGVMGHNCKCGFVYCKNHRLPEEHDCTYDFAAKERERLAKSNPLIAGNKIDKL